MTVEEALARWGDRAASSFGSHPQRCCEVARAWFRAMALSAGASRTARLETTWISIRYPWGPSPWPLHWCKAVRSRELDCGAHTALAREAFALGGVPTSSVHLVQRIPPRTASHWQARWTRAGQPADWIAEDVVWHEACGVLEGDELVVWDSARAGWVTPGSGDGYQVVAVRLCDPGDLRWPRKVRWGPAGLEIGRWTILAGSEEQGVRRSGG